MNTCAGTPPVCTLNEVVDGLAVVSLQLHGLAAYVMVASSLVVVCLVVIAGLTWANHR